MTEDDDDAINISWMMQHYCKLSKNGKRRASRIFELILADVPPNNGVEPTEQAGRAPTSLESAAHAE